MNYQFNIRGWMTKINDPQNLGTKLFGYELRYNNPVNTASSTGRFNGNIAEATWQTASDQWPKRYNYQYDGLNRLLTGIYSEPEDTTPANNYYNETLTYDLNGNILSLVRNTKDAGGLTPMDNLAYDYNYPVSGNRLQSVTDSSSNYGGYPDTSGTAIPYDLNGNMKSHDDKGIENLDYNHLNLPNHILFNFGLATRLGILRNNTSYIYRADGVKLKKVYNFAPVDPYGTATDLSTEVTDYIDGFQYKGSRQAGPRGGSTFVTSLLFYPTAEGYYNFENNKYIYNYTDHLGNVRLSYVNNGNGAEILEENNYYPFGLKHEVFTMLSGNPSYQYKYNGKELQTESGMYDYGARFYMPDIGRWGVVDPLAEKMRRWSPYNYAFNNPVMFIDPDGREGILYGEQARNAFRALQNSMPPDDHFDINGNFIYRDNKKTNNVIVHGVTWSAKLSELDYSKQGTLKSVSNILAHYAGEKNIRGYVGVTNMESKTAGAFTNPYTKNVVFNINQLKEGTYDNAYNIKSTLNHEGGVLGHKNEHYNKYTFELHSKVYLNEALNPDFAKTTDAYKAGQAASFVNHVLNADVKESVYGGANHLDMLNQYNQNKAGVQVSIYTGGNGLTTGASINVSINGKNYGSSKYKDLKNPQD